MAHFAQIDNNGTVLRVLAVADAECLCDEGTESEHVGCQFCASHFGGDWVQTSYTGRIRKRFAGVGFTYDAAMDSFIPPKPYPSWVLDESTCDWVAPVQRPSGGPFRWDEQAMAWVESPMPVS